MDKDDVLLERIILNLKHQSKMLVIAITLCSTAILSFIAGQQSYAVLNVNIGFAWASIISLIGVYTFYLLAASSLQTIDKSISGLSFISSEPDDKNNQRAVDLATKLMTETVLFNPFSLLGNHPKFGRYDLREMAYGPYGMLLVTSIAPLLLSKIAGNVSLPNIIESLHLNQYMAFIVNHTMGLLFLGSSAFIYLFYLFYACRTPFRLVGEKVSFELVWFSKRKRVLFFIAPIAVQIVIGVITDLVWVIEFSVDQWERRVELSDKIKGIFELVF